MLNIKKSISPIIAMSLLLVTAIIALTTFQTWFTNYQSFTHSDIETKDSDIFSNTQITNVIGDTLYFYNGLNDTIEIKQIKINSILCDVRHNATYGLNHINIENCTSSLNNGEIEVFLLTEKKTYTKMLYFVSGNNTITNGAGTNESSESNKLNYTVALSIANPNAEDGTNNWTNVVGALTLRTSDPPGPFDGSYYFFGGPNSRTTSKQKINIRDYFGADLSEINKTMYLNIDYKQSSWDNDDALRMGVDFLDENNNSIEGINYIRATSTTKSIWTDRKIVANIPLSTHYADIYIDIIRYAGTNNDGYVDYISAYIDGKTPGIMNPDAESYLDYWTNINGGISRKVNSGAPAPINGSAFFFGRTSALTIAKQKIEVFNLYNSSNLDIFAERDVNLTINWIQASYAADDKAGVGIEFLDKDNNNLSSIEYVPVITISPSRTWVNRSISKKIPANTYYANIYLRFERTAGTNNDGYIDQITHEFE